MVKASFCIRENSASFTIKGHSGFSEEGSDIVCAAVSSAAIMSVNTITEILGVKIPMNTIPITPGRNLAVILEVAAMNNRQRKFGYNPAQEFTNKINRHFEKNMGNQV